MRRAGPPPAARHARRSVAGTATLVANSLLEIGVSFVFAVLLARRLGVADFGLLNFALAWSAVLTMVADAGLTLYVGKLVARSGGGWAASYRRAFRLKLTLLAVLLPPLVVLSLLHPTVRAHTGVLLVLLAGETVRSVSVFVCFAFRGLRRAYFEPLVLGAERVLLLGAGAAALWAGLGLRGVAAAFVAARAVSFVIATVLMRRLALETGAGARRSAGLPVRLATSLRLGLFLICDRLLIQGTTVLMMLCAAEWETGIFQAAYKIVMVPAMLSAAFCGSLIGPLTAAHARGPARFERVFLGGLKTVTHAMLALAAALLLWGPRLVTVLYGAAYADAAGALRILVLHFGGFGLYHLALFGFIALNEERYLSGVMLAAVLASLVLTPLAAAAGGAAGAAWSLAGISVGINAAFLLRLSARGVRIGRAGLLLPVAVVAVVALLPVRWFAPATAPAALPVLLLLAATVAAWGAAAWAWFLTPEDRQQVGTMLALLRGRAAAAS